MTPVATFLGPVFYKLVYMSLTALAVGAAVLLLRRLADKRFSPFWKYVMWGLVLAALVIPWRPQSRAAVLSPVEAVQALSYREVYGQAQSNYSALLAEEQTQHRVILSPSHPQQVAAAKGEAAALRIKTLVFDELLPLLWLCGAAGAAVYMGIEAVRLRRRVRRSAIANDMGRYDALLEGCKCKLNMKRRVGILLQSHVGTPALLGLIRPVILLPGYAAELSDEHLEYVILHELSHLRRGDSLVNTLLLALRAVYWFNPLVWLLFRFVREDMELANDAAVLRGLGSEARREYSLSLLEVLAGCGKQRPAMLCMADSKKNIERRIGMIQLGSFFKKRKWVIAAAGVLVIAALATLFLTTRPKQAEDQSTDQKALMSSLGYSQEVLATIQKNKTPYVGEAPKAAAIAQQLPPTWKGISYDHISLQTKEEPYGMTILYQETAENSITDYQDNPFSAAMEENNALLLFAAIANLGEVTLDMPADMQDAQFTREQISGIFGGIPSMDDLNAIYDKLSNHLKMEEFYFAHATRQYLLGTTQEDVVYREGVPERIFTNPAGLTVYEYRHVETYTDGEGASHEIENYMMYFYFEGSELLATRTEVTSEISPSELITWFGQPAQEITIAEQTYRAYQLRKSAADAPAKYAWFLMEHDRVTASGLMVGDDVAILSTQAIKAGEALSPTFLSPGAGRDALKSLIYGSEGWWLDTQGDYIFARFWRYVLRYDTKTNQIDQFIDLGDAPDSWYYAASFSPDGQSCIAQARGFDGPGETAKVLIDLKNNTVAPTEQEHFAHSTQGKNYKVEIRHFQFENEWCFNDDDENHEKPVHIIKALKPYAQGVTEAIAMDKTRVGALVPTSSEANGYLGYYKFVLVDLAQDKIVQECPLNILGKGEQFPTWPDETAPHLQ